MLFSSLALALSAISGAVAHYTFPAINNQPAWQFVRKTNNFNTRNPVTDVKSADFRCYTSETGATASTLTVAAGSTLTGTIYHPGVLNVYMAKVANASTADGSGNVWFKVYQISAVTDGGKSISWPSNNLASVSFKLPSALPTGQYLVRIEHIALHAASTYGGAQFYLSCAQINVTGGGSGTPGPLVAIPGVYTGNEPGILININYPIPATYTQPGPAVWSG
ncbi:glycoside hydrolase family 61 protein [Exidia glandulosa HHB12029]|uniref:lytic cellulose monooxygenase (C4-dehydrogenating) n=1 Tax=Exidia glandulosa HHB12029 TaxID=1314781 RepID=A0A165KKV9_EXIGL|nr:glycoside hydrolase family 61 protein [Exidia glandulosa HHB12029]